MRTLKVLLTCSFIGGWMLFFYFNVNSTKAQDEKKERKTNVIVILIDDAGYADFGFMGSKELETPEIDRLAKSGTTFSDAHVSSVVCAPSRAGLITGQYQQRFGFEANHTGDQESGDIGLADDVMTLADVFQDHEYTTTAIGKWHLGATESDLPNNRGFDEFYGFLAGGRSYFPIENPTKELMLQHNGERVHFEGYLTDVLGDYSVKFVEDHKDTPFFMYLAYNAVHTPMHAKEEHLEKYKDHPRKELAAMTWSLDENIGKLINKLHELGIAENTLVYFLSDNGGALMNSSKNTPLKGWKGNEFEGGHRVPFVMSWPGTIKAGETFDGLTSALDIFSTSLAAANIPTPENALTDGVNLLPYLSGEQTGNPHDELYWRKLNTAGARVGDLKLVRLEGFDEALYDLANDLVESNDLSESDTLTLKKMIRHLEGWESEMTTPLWKEKKEWMDVTYHIHQRLMKNQQPQYTDPTKHKEFKEKNKNRQ